jgi:hypothetical protein
MKDRDELSKRLTWIIFWMITGMVLSMWVVGMLIAIRYLL